MKTVYMRIDGRVQRIGFRRWVVSKALALGGLSGWTRNLEDGSVEVLMRGEEAKLDEMIKYCYQGPLFARVDKISFDASAGYLEFLPQIKEGCFFRL